MTYLDNAKSYLKGLEATRSKIIYWEGDVRVKPHINIPLLIKEIVRVKDIVHNMEGGKTP
jgi:hypothetical protein|tara:strand:- start:340 stop:519 length:180 start_codon:yes stop_codon:yes gene_type:complete